MLRHVWKAVVVLLLTAAGFVIGFLITGAWHDQNVMPELVKHYPHDGQLGLASFVEALNGGFVGALVGLVSGGMWAYLPHERNASEDED